MISAFGVEHISKDLERTGLNRKPSMTQRLARSKSEAWMGTSQHAATVLNHATDPTIFRPAMQGGRAIFQQQATNPETVKYATHQMKRGVDLAQRYGRVATARTAKPIKATPTNRQIGRAIKAAAKLRKSAFGIDHG